MPREDSQFKLGHAPAHVATGNVAGSKNRTRELTPRQAVFLREYLRDGNGKRAALAAGYSDASAHSRAYEFLHKNSATMNAIATARNAVLDKAEYNLESLMRELNEGAQFAIHTKNATALARFCELKAKACGLLIERIDQRQLGGFQIRIIGVDDAPAAAAPRVISPEDDTDIFS